MICVYPNCPCTSRTRGLCHGHYQQARAMIRKGRADEADLVRRNLMLPTGVPGATPIIGSRAFDKGSAVIGDALIAQLTKHGKSSAALNLEVILDVLRDDGTAAAGIWMRKNMQTLRGVIAEDQHRADVLNGERKEAHSHV